MSTPNTVKRTYRFPTFPKLVPGLKNWHSAVRLADDVRKEFLTELRVELGKLGHDLGNDEMWFELAFDELFVNIVHHDQMGFTGGERDKLWDENVASYVMTPNEAELLAEKFGNAEGCESDVIATVTQERLVIEIGLNRPFEEFDRLWAATLQELTEEEVGKASGRGLRLMRRFFTDGECDNEAKVLRFWHNF